MWLNGMALSMKLTLVVGVGPGSCAAVGGAANWGDWGGPVGPQAGTPNCWADAGAAAARSSPTARAVRARGLGGPGTARMDTSGGQSRSGRRLASRALYGAAGVGATPVV